MLGCFAAALLAPDSQKVAGGDSEFGNHVTSKFRIRTSFFAIFYKSQPLAVLSAW